MHYEQSMKPSMAPPRFLRGRLDRLAEQNVIQLFE